MLAIMLHGDGVELDMALKTVAQYGMMSLELLRVIYDAKFELLCINAAMLDLRKRLQVRAVFSKSVTRAFATAAVQRAIDK
jgi:hypothetical protein